MTRGRSTPLTCPATSHTCTAASTPCADPAPDEGGRPVRRLRARRGRRHPSARGGGCTSSPAAATVTSASSCPWATSLLRQLCQDQLIFLPLAIL
uniref:Uncharacterized protein n=1 Tax=Oryza glaberrima TaxID=4538 RepID=I1R2L3_ORYGL